MSVIIFFELSLDVVCNLCVTIATGEEVNFSRLCVDFNPIVYWISAVQSSRWFTLLLTLFISLPVLTTASGRTIPLHILLHWHFNMFNSSGSCSFSIFLRYLPTCSFLLRWSSRERNRIMKYNDILCPLLLVGSSHAQLFIFTRVLLSLLYLMWRVLKIGKVLLTSKRRS